MDTAEDDLSGLREAEPAVALSKGKGRAVRMRAPCSIVYALVLFLSFFFDGPSFLPIVMASVSQ